MLNPKDYGLKNVLIFSHVPLWDAHHAESVELALCEYNKGNKVFLSHASGHYRHALLILIEIKRNVFCVDYKLEGQQIKYCQKI